MSEYNECPLWKKCTVHPDHHAVFDRFQMTKDQLISVIKKILGTDADLEFLAKLDLAELRLLVACIRERIEGEKG